jgi:hypothetical protein
VSRDILGELVALPSQGDARADHFEAILTDLGIGRAETFDALSRVLDDQRVKPDAFEVVQADEKFGTVGVFRYADRYYLIDWCPLGGYDLIEQEEYFDLATLRSVDRATIESIVRSVIQNTQKLQQALLV